MKMKVMESGYGIFNDNDELVSESNLGKSEALALLVEHNSKPVVKAKETVKKETFKINGVEYPLITEKTPKPIIIEILKVLGVDFNYDEKKAYLYNLLTEELKKLPVEDMSAEEMLASEAKSED
jgi:hypothetical protein